MKRCLAIILSLMLLLSCFTACGNNETTPTISPSADGETEAVANVPEVEEPIEFSILFSAPAEFNPEGNAWVEAVNEKVNAKITWIAYPQSSFQEKRVATMAGTDYPDVIIMNTTSGGLNDNLYNSMVKNNIILPLDEYLNEETAPNILKYTHEAAWEAVKDPSGSTYVIPRCTIIREDYMCVRTDWLEALEMEVPTTIDEWLEFGKAVVKNDPNGNGVADTYAITDVNGLISYSGTNSMDFFARAWHAGKSWYLDENGDLFYGLFAKDGRFKNVLQFYQDMYAEGALDPNFISLKGSTDNQQRLEQGAVSALRLFAGNMDRHLSVIRGISPEANLTYTDFPTAATSADYANEIPVTTNAGLYNGWCLTSNAKGKEERIIEVLDWMLSDEGWDLIRNGVEGVHYNMEGDTKVNTDEYKTFSQYSGYIQLLRRPNDENLWLKNIIPETREYQKEWLDYSVAAMQKYQQTGLVGIQSAAEKEFLKSDLYTTEFPQLCIEIIYGEKSVDEWDAFLEKVYENGWKDVLDEYNAYYQEHK